MKLLLIRHGEASDEFARDGAADPGLTALGEAQAEAVAAFLQSEQIAAIHSSPARRALATAQPLAEKIGLEIREEAALLEFNHGASDYLSIEEMRRRGDPRWDALQRGELYDSALTAAELRTRIASAIDRIVSQHAGETVAVFTHAGVINLHVGGLVGARAAIWTAPGHAGISRILADRRGRRMLLSLNELAHVRELTGATTPQASSHGQAQP
jgi:broad specificity phosphatase PhoE